MKPGHTASRSNVSRGGHGKPGKVGTAHNVDLGGLLTIAADAGVFGLVGKAVSGNEKKKKAKKKSANRIAEDALKGAGQ